MTISEVAPPLQNQNCLPRYSFALLDHFTLFLCRPLALLLFPLVLVQIPYESLLVISNCESETCLTHLHEQEQFLLHAPGSSSKNTFTTISLIKRVNIEWFGTMRVIFSSLSVSGSFPVPVCSDLCVCASLIAPIPISG